MCAVWKDSGKNGPAKPGFDNEKYLKMQSEHIRERIAKFGNKLYLEFGGKLFDDYHASRVLPGFRPDSKINMLMQLKEDAEIVIAINSADIEKNKVRGDLGITYDVDVLRLIDAFRNCGLYVGSVVMTRFAEQPSAVAYGKKLQSLGIKVYHHYRGPNEDDIHTDSLTWDDPRRVLQLPNNVIESGYPSNRTNSAAGGGSGAGYVIQSHKQTSTPKLYQK